MGQIAIVDGADYVGKSTTLAALAKILTDAGYTVHIYREPGGHPFAETIRELIFNTAGLKQAKKYKALLFYASRDITLRESVLPLLEDDNTIVLYDRFNLTSLVYQGLLAEDLKYVLALDELVLGDVFADIKVSKFLLTITPDEMKRRMACSREGNSYDPSDAEEAMRRQQGFKVMGSTRGYIEVDNTMGGATKAIYGLLQEG